MYRTLILAALLLIHLPLQADDAVWQQTINRYSSSIISIEIDIPVDFDTSRAVNAEATGFVVDAERGIILTNRHVVQQGPVVARAIFHNQQELPLTAIYRDPVHDFGFFRYDPKALRDGGPEGIELRPELARVGMPIRVIGNDSGERFSIADSTLARLDRNVPNYGERGYNDFNTFYYQAASGASGGSSGSPVLNSEGKAIALQAAGAFFSNTNLFLPLDRIRYALTHIQQGKAVPRGSLETTFVHQSDDELRRLGAGDAQIASLRRFDPEGNGGLVVDRVQPGGPAAGKLRSGDILLTLDGTPVVAFSRLESTLDSKVGKTLTLAVSRDGKPVQQALTVGDLHAITPDEYVTISNAVLQPMGYQQARHLDLPVRGVVLTSTGFMFGNAGVPAGSVIREINAAKVPDLKTAQQLLEGIADQVDFTLRYTPPDTPKQSRVAVVTNDRRWFFARHCRHVAGAPWQCEKLAAAPPAAAAEQPKLSLAQQSTPLASDMLASLARVSFYAPYTVDGVPGNASSATGLVVDAKAGLLITDRGNVPNVIGDAYVTFGGSVRIPAEVVYLHPLHNIVMLHYDPARLGDSAVKSARLSRKILRPGDEIWAMGLVQNDQVRQQRRRILEYFPLPETTWEKASFQDRDLMILATAQSYFLNSGVFVNDVGEVAAMIMSFRYGRRSGSRHTWAIPIAYVNDLLQQWHTRETQLRSLGLDMHLAGFDYARRLGVTSSQLASIAAIDATRREVLMVSQVFPGSPAEGKVRSGDVLLGVNGHALNGFRALERAVQHPQVKLELSRNGQVEHALVKPLRLDTLGTRKLVFWAGANIQALNRKLHSIAGTSVSGVYVNATAPGSPARRAQITGKLIVAMDGRPIAGLDDLARRAAASNADAGVRLRLRDLDGTERVTSLLVPRHRWPLSAVVRHHGMWQRTLNP